MPYATRERYHASVLTIKGRFLGSLERSALTRTIDGWLDAGKNRLVIDFSQAEFMDSTGIGLLIEAAKRMRADGGDVRLAGVEHRIKNLFVMTHLLGPVFDDFTDVEEALVSYAEAA